MADTVVRKDWKGWKEAGGGFTQRQENRGKETLVLIWEPMAAYIYDALGCCRAPWFPLLSHRSESRHPRSPAAQWRGLTLLQPADPVAPSVGANRMLLPKSTLFPTSPKLKVVTVLIPKNFQSKHQVQKQKCSLGTELATHDKIKAWYNPILFLELATRTLLCDTMLFKSGL